MEEKKTSELNDETLDKVAGGKYTLINGRITHVCNICEKPLPHWYEHEVCKECLQKHFA